MCLTQWRNKPLPNKPPKPQPRKSLCRANSIEEQDTLMCTKHANTYLVCNTYYWRTRMRCWEEVRSKIWPASGIHLGIHVTHCCGVSYSLCNYQSPHITHHSRLGQFSLGLFHFTGPEAVVFLGVTVECSRYSSQSGTCPLQPLMRW